MDYIKESRETVLNVFRGILFIYIFAKGMFFFRGYLVSPLHKSDQEATVSLPEVSAVSSYLSTVMV